MRRASAALPTASDLRRVAASVRDLAQAEALAVAHGGVGRTLLSMLADAADRATWSIATTTDARSLYRALATAYLRIAGVEWRALTGQAAWDVARRACELADEL